MAPDCHVVPAPHVHQGLGFSTFVVGLVAGAQFAAALISRLWSGAYADRQGAKRAVQMGLQRAAAAGLLYIFSRCGLSAHRACSVRHFACRTRRPWRGQSFIITGATIWGLARVGAHNAGEQVIAWMGMAMFGGFAVGAPFGTAMYDAAGCGQAGRLPRHACALPHLGFDRAASGRGWRVTTRTGHFLPV